MRGKEMRLKKRLQVEEHMLRQYLGMLKGKKTKPQKRFRVVRGKTLVKARG
ncbi:MAG: hypothetical protein AB1500_08595 [Bacillota bacterium]